MKKFRRTLLKTFFILLIFITFLGFFTRKLKQPLGKFSPTLSSQLEAGVVTAVYDGDTIRVKFKKRLQKKVRLIGVDSPEIKDSREDVKFWAHMAKRFSFYNLYQKEVKLSYDWQLEDKYGRLLAYVWTDKGLFNDFIIREGFGYVFLNFPFRKDYQKKFKESEEGARKERKGLWKRGDFLQIKVFEVKRHLGELISVEYPCAIIESKREFVFLHSPGREFSALIPQDYLVFFPTFRSFLNRDLVVTGFLEEYKGQPQVIVYFPRQIEVKD